MPRRTTGPLPLLVVLLHSLGWVATQTHAETHVVVNLGPYRSIETAGHTTPRPHLSFDWPGDDAILNRYIDDQKVSRTETIVTALADRGVITTPIATESEDPVSEILRFASDDNYDVICIGTHGQGRFEGLLGSTSTKITRRAPSAVLTIRS